MEAALCLHYSVHLCFALPCLALNGFKVWVSEQLSQTAFPRILCLHHHQPPGSTPSLQPPNPTSAAQPRYSQPPTLELSTSPQASPLWTRHWYWHVLPKTRIALNRKPSLSLRASHLCPTRRAPACLPYALRGTGLIGAAISERKRAGTSFTRNPSCVLLPSALQFAKHPPTTLTYLLTFPYSISTNGPSVIGIVGTLALYRPYRGESEMHPHLLFLVHHRCTVSFSDYSKPLPWRDRGPVAAAAVADRDMLPVHRQHVKVEHLLRMKDAEETVAQPPHLLRTANLGKPCPCPPSALVPA